MPTSGFAIDLDIRVISSAKNNMVLNYFTEFSDMFSPSGESCPCVLPSQGRTTYSWIGVVDRFHEFEQIISMRIELIRIEISQHKHESKATDPFEKKIDKL